MTLPFYRYNIFLYVIFSFFSAVYKNCSEAPKETRIYYMTLGMEPEHFPVYCDQTSDGGGSQHFLLYDCSFFSFVETDFRKKKRFNVDTC